MHDDSALALRRLVRRGIGVAVGSRRNRVLASARVTRRRPVRIGSKEQPANVPLVVSVDGALVTGDLAIERLGGLFAAEPWRLFVLPVWLFRGGSALRRRIAELAPLRPETLALNPSVMNEITVAQKKGCQVWLASDLDAGIVEPLTEAIGATGHLCLKARVGPVGQSNVEVLVNKFGQGGFDYIGSERSDLAAWKRARRAICVSPSAGLARRVRKLD